MKSRPLLLLITFFWITSLGAQTFQAFMIRIQSLPIYERQAVADSFLNTVSAFPIIEYDTLVHFIYTGDAQSVSIAGDQTQWSPSLNLMRIEGTTFWSLSTHYERDARLDYKIVLNNSNWILDPRNPNTCTGGYGPNSELRMPFDPVPPEISYYADIPHGSVHDTLCHSTALNNNRTMKIYLPPNYPEAGKKYPVILFHDGPEYLSLGATANILDYLIANGSIKPVIALFVPPVDRNAEYAGTKKDLFISFIADELMPAIDGGYATTSDPQQRATVGASNGGNIALYLGVKHPELFGCIAAQSSNVIPSISDALLTGPLLPLNFYLDIGTYDIGVLIPMVHNLDSILTLRQYPHQMLDIHQGHSWGNWKEHLKIPLIRFFAIPAGFNENRNDHKIRLEQNSPNPFHDNTRILFSAPAGSQVTITLCNVQGKLLETLFSGTVVQNMNEIILSKGDYLPGQYLCTLHSKGHKAIKKIVIN